MKGIPIPENDWLSLNIRLDQIEKMMGTIDTRITNVSKMVSPELEAESVTIDIPPGVQEPEEPEVPEEEIVVEPGNVTFDSTNSVFTGEHPELVWHQLPDSGYDYEIRKDVNFGVKDSNLVTIETDTDNFTVKKWKPADGASATFYIKSRNSDKVYSKNYRSITLTNPVPGTVGSVTLTVTKRSHVIAWTKLSETDIDGYNIYRHTANNSGASTLIKQTSKGDSQFQDGKAIDGTTYYYWLKARDVFSQLSAAFSTVVYKSSVPADPTGLQYMVVEGDAVKFQWTKNTEEDMGEYLIYINTSDTTSGAEVIARVKHPTHKVSVKVGDKSEAAGFTVAYNTTYYFWISAQDEAGDESSLVQFARDGSNEDIMVYKSDWVRSYGNPWKMKNKTTYYYKRSTVGNTEHTVSAGKIALLEGYTLIGTDAANYSEIDLYDDAFSNYTLDIAGTVGTIRRKPSFTNGIYLYEGCKFRLTISGGTGCSCKMKILEFDTDTNISPLIKFLLTGSTYTVTTGRGLVITYCFAYVSGVILQQYLNGGWEDVWQAEAAQDKLGVEEGCLYFPSQAQIRGSAASDPVCFIGYEIPGL